MPCGLLPDFPQFFNIYKSHQDDVDDVFPGRKNLERCFPALSEYANSPTVEASDRSLGLVIEVELTKNIGS